MRKMPQWFESYMEEKVILVEMCLGTFLGEIGEKSFNNSKEKR